MVTGHDSRRALVQMALVQMAQIRRVLMVLLIACCCITGLLYLSAASHKKVRLHDVPLINANIRVVSSSPRTKPETKPETKQADSLMPIKVIGSLYNEPFEKFTLLMQTFDRTDLLLRLLKYFVQIPELDRVLIVWNNIGVTPPYEVVQDYAVEIVFLKQSVNKMRNRLQNFPEIRTEGMYSIHCP